MTDQPLKKCDKCGQEKPPSSYYPNGVQPCRACTRAARVLVPLDQQLEAHKQGKMLREELKKLARERLDKRKRAKQAKKRAALEPTKPEPEAPPVSSVTQELARRALQRRKLIEFIKAFHPRYLAGWVHHDICRRLEKFSDDVLARKSPRLMILMPPRHGKTQIASKMFPAWHLGRAPHHEFIGCSYNMPLALESSREIRNIIRSPHYELLFENTKLDPEFQSAETWKLMSPTSVGSGGYVAAGTGGGITGKGAHILTIDDPIKNEEEAESLDIRAKIWGWYLTSAYNRLAPGGGILVIQTWWHDDDLAGRLQQMMKENPDDPYVDKFEIVKYPAIAEEDEEFRLKGEPLHPERYSLEQLLRIQRQYGGPLSRYWSALYQQNPIPTEGAYFTKDMLQYRDETLNIPDLDIYQAWDLAISSDQQKAANWTVGTTVGLDHLDMVHVLERVRIKTNDSAKIEDAIIDMYANYPKVSGVGFEDGQIFKTLRTSLKRRMQERKVYIPLDEKANILKPVTDKEVRARPLQARLQNKKVTFPRGQVWVDEMWKELLRFPAGVQDDQVDSLSWTIHLLLGKPSPRPPKPKFKSPEKTVAQKLAAFARTGGVRGSGHMGA